VGGEEGVLRFIIKLIDVMQNKGWQIVFIPAWSKDMPYIEEAVKRIGRPISIFSDYTSVDKVVDFLEKCDIFVGEKLHSVILAMCAHTPSIMLEYRPKCLDFMMSMKQEEFNVRTDMLSLDSIIDLVDKLYENLEYYQDKIHEQINYYKEIQTRKAKMITNMISNI
jgi:polysaccharide pyruvyl transferase WcaK-like protein